MSPYQKEKYAKILAGVLASLVILIAIVKRLMKKIEKPVQPGIIPIDMMIRKIALEMHVDPELAVKVAKCESNLNPMAVNENINSSKDRGLFQWNDKWHPEITDQCAFDPVCATKEFCKAVRNGHLSWWNNSKHCWGV